MKVRMPYLIQDYTLVFYCRDFAGPCKPLPLQLLAALGPSAIIRIPDVLVLNSGVFQKET